MEYKKYVYTNDIDKCQNIFINNLFYEHIELIEML